MTIGIDQAAFDTVARLGRPALAWEVLRRDPAYRRAALFASSQCTCADWGLHFR